MEHSRANGRVQCVKSVSKEVRLLHFNEVKLVTLFCEICEGELSFLKKEKVEEKVWEEKEYHEMR